MAKKPKPAPVKSTIDTSPKIHEATRGNSGSVRKGKEITQDEAEARRKAGLDVVVCGPSLTANRNLAGQNRDQRTWESEAMPSPGRTKIFATLAT
jgi:hypothetical protein